MIIKCDVSLLHDEFTKFGIYPFPVFDLEDGTGSFEFEENVDMEKVEEIIKKYTKDK